MEFIMEKVISALGDGGKVTQYFSPELIHKDPRLIPKKTDNSLNPSKIIKIAISVLLNSFGYINSKSKEKEVGVDDISKELVSTGIWK